MAAREAYSLYVERAVEGANEACWCSCFRARDGSRADREDLSGARLGAPPQVFCASMPPSTTTTAPLTYEAAGKTRLSVMWATSSGSP